MNINLSNFQIPRQPNQPDDYGEIRLRSGLWIRNRSDNDGNNTPIGEEDTSERLENDIRGGMDHDEDPSEKKYHVDNNDNSGQIDRVLIPVNLLSNCQEDAEIHLEVSRIGNDSNESEDNTTQENDNQDIIPLGEENNLPISNQ
ncbi:hypothetical protein CRE_28092 [Caenorhabditis remanei]|uniref:Uncharacterized protein n=2 Tax=Caenorhabditis remanei TaxID=31234 RepID=E3LM88_CAERE|nr:hypothetical protein CRE_28092 [Caenorhabditis remanei]